MQTRESLEKKFNSARSTLLLITLLSAVNVGLELLGSSIAFTLSASSPLFAIVLTQDEAGANSPVGIVIALLIVAFFLVCWIASKKNQGMMIAALVAFVLDTILLLGIIAMVFMDGGFEFNIIIEIVFHVLALAALISGASTCLKLKKLPPVDPNAPPAFYDASGNPMPLNGTYYTPAQSTDGQMPQTYRLQQPLNEQQVQNPPELQALQHDTPPSLDAIQQYQAPQQMDAPPIPYQEPKQDSKVKDEQ